MITPGGLELGGVGRGGSAVRKSGGEGQGLGEHLKEEGESELRKRREEGWGE